MAQAAQLLPEESLPLPGQSGPNLLDIAWRRKSLIALGIVVGMVVGVLYYAQAKPIYQSRAQVLLVKKRPDSVTGIDTRQTGIEDLVATHQTIIKSPFIIKRAMRRSSLAELPCFVGDDDPPETIFKGMSATRNKTVGVNTSNVLDLAFRTTSAEDSTKILNAVIESYQDYLDEDYNKVSNDTLGLVLKAQNILEKDLKKLKQEHNAFLANDAPVLLRDKDGVPPLTHERLGSIEAKRTGLLVRKAEIQGNLTAIEQAQKKGVAGNAPGHDGRLGRQARGREEPQRRVSTVAEPARSVAPGRTEVAGNKGPEPPRGQGSAQANRDCPERHDQPRDCLG